MTLHNVKKACLMRLLDPLKKRKRRKQKISKHKYIQILIVIITTIWFLLLIAMTYKDFLFMSSTSPHLTCVVISD